jgi:putative phosphoribosyl transferase
VRVTTVMVRRFHDRRDAGRRLAGELRDYENRDDVVVLGLPRGGVPVAYEVALALHAPLDVFVVRKLGLPWQEELAMGAIASGGVRVLDHELIEVAHVSPADVERVTAMERAELARREQQYRDGRPFPPLDDKTAILVDDGLATGASMRAAVSALRQERPARIVVAVPVAAPAACEAFRHLADDVVCAETPEPFYGVGLWYEDFTPTSDDEVRDLIEHAKHVDLARSRA